MNTSGFYFHDTENNEVIYAPTFVYAPSFTLLAEEKDSYTYPVNGWFWFDSQADAYANFGLPLPEEEE